MCINKFKLEYSQKLKLEEQKVPEQREFKIKCSKDHEARLTYLKPKKYIGRTDCNECRNPVYLADGFYHCEACRFDLCSICYEMAGG